MLFSISTSRVFESVWHAITTLALNHTGVDQKGAAFTVYRCTPRHSLRPSDV